MPIERMPDPADLVPGAREALTALRRAIASAGLGERLLALTDPAAGPARGQTGEERAVRALTAAVTRPGPVPERVWDHAAKHFDQRELAALLLSIAITDATHRIDISLREQ